MKHYSHILSPDETLTLFTNLEKVFARILLLEIHTKKLRRKIARHSTLNKTSARNMLELSLKGDDHNPGEILMTTSEELLVPPGGGTQNKNSELENSYLLTEMDSVSSRPSSPTAAGGGSVLNTSGNLRKKRALKTEALRMNEKKIREEEGGDQTTDFVEYLEFLVEYFK